MSGDIADLARSKFGEPNRRLSTRAELRFGRHGSVSVCMYGERAGLWFDHEGQVGGRLTDGTERQTASDRPSGLLSWDSPSADKFQSVLDHELCAVDDHAVARDYLLSRGINRWPAHSVKGWRSGICYLARSASGSILALQLLPLSPGGRKNRSYWPDGVTKRTYAACGGWVNYAAVRMPGKGEVVLCEGVETGLSIWLATGRPVAACMGVSGFANLRIGRKLTIARDGDEPGSPADKAAARAVEVRRRLRQRVRVAIPPVGKDFNDLHQSDGLAVVKAIIGAAKEQ